MRGLQIQNTHHLLSFVSEFGEVDVDLRLFGAACRTQIANFDGCQKLTYKLLVVMERAECFL